MDNCLISIVIPTRRPEQLKKCLHTLIENTHNTSKIELIIKVDEDQKEIYEEFKKTDYPFKLTWVVSPRLYGYYTMWANNYLTIQYLNPDSYFVLAVTDEGEFQHGWDKIVRSYYKYFKDDIFRIKLSHAMHLNYYNIGQLNYLPDSFFIITKKWLDILSGFGDCWGADVFMQSVSYHLGRGVGSIYHPLISDPISRDVPINKKIIKGLDIFGNTEDDVFSSSCKQILMYDEWARNVSYKTQSMHSFYANLTRLHIKASELCLKEFKILHFDVKKILILIDSNNKINASLSYKVSKLNCILYSGYFKLLKLKIIIALSNYKFYPVTYYLKKYSKKFGKLLGLHLIYRRWLHSKVPAKRIDNFNNDLVIFNSENNIINQPIFTLDAGGLYDVNNENKFVPSKFFKKMIKAHNYVNCTDEEFITNVDKIFVNGYKTGL